MNTRFADCDRAEDGSRVIEDLGLAPLATSRPIQRIASIGFLGILGRSDDTRSFSRAQHSFGVALLTTIMLRQLPERIRRHAAAAALLHDAAQWAFSHTCEGVFRRLSGVSAKEILHGMLFDERLLDAKYHLRRSLAASDLDPAVVWDLLCDKRTLLSRLGRTEWGATAEAFSCAANPDTLDGIARAAAVFRVDCPDVRRIAAAFEVVDDHLRITAEALPLLDEFWTAKTNVYEAHIHTSESLRLEVDVSAKIKTSFHGARFGELFESSDDDLRDVIDHEPNYLREPDGDRLDLALLFRYPRRYFIRQTHRFDDAKIPAPSLKNRYVAKAVYDRTDGYRQRANSGHADRAHRRHPLSSSGTGVPVL